VPFFAKLLETVRSDIAALLQPDFIDPREKIISTREIDYAMYFVSSGAVTIKMAKRKIELGSGDFYGEMALINNKPRNAGVIADTYCDLLVLPKKYFQKLMDNNLKLKAVVYDVVMQRAADTSKGVSPATS
jgi:CPA1 family monovalent cation:H+ antiporter